MQEEDVRIVGRPTIYKGTTMRSRMEAGFAAWCDSVGFTWRYEGPAFASQAGQYLPDFTIQDVQCTWREEPVTLYVETKPDAFWDSRYDRKAVADRMAIIFDSGTIGKELVIAVPPTGGGLLQFPRLVSVQPAGNLDDPTRSERAFIFPAEWAVGTSERPVLALLRKGPWSDEYWAVR